MPHCIPHRSPPHRPAHGGDGAAAGVQLKDHSCSGTDDTETEDDSDLFVNPNRPQVEIESSESSSEEEES